MLSQTKHTTHFPYSTLQDSSMVDVWALVPLHGVCNLHVLQGRLPSLLPRWLGAGLLMQRGRCLMLTCSHSSLDSSRWALSQEAS